MHALWYPTLLACPWEWDATSSGFLLVSIVLVLHPTLMPGWVPALAEEPGEGKHEPHARAPIPAKCCPCALELCSPKSLGAQHCRGQCQEVLAWGMACCQSGQQDPERWRWYLSADAEGAGDVIRIPSLAGMSCMDALPALRGSLHRMRR